MEISESDFRRLHWKSRKLDEVCRIIWPENARPASAIETLLTVEGVIGEYRPGPLRTVDQFLDGENRYADGEKVSR